MFIYVCVYIYIGTLTGMNIYLKGSYLLQGVFITLQQCRSHPGEAERTQNCSVHKARHQAVPTHSFSLAFLKSHWYSNHIGHLKKLFWYHWRNAVAVAEAATWQMNLLSKHKGSGKKQNFFLNLPFCLGFHQKVPATFRVCLATLNNFIEKNLSQVCPVSLSFSWFQI